MSARYIEEYAGAAGLGIADAVRHADAAGLALVQCKWDGPVNARKGKPGHRRCTVGPVDVEIALAVAADDIRLIRIMEPGDG